MLYDFILSWGKCIKAVFMAASKCPNNDVSYGGFIEVSLYFFIMNNWIDLNIVACIVIGDSFNSPYSSWALFFNDIAIFKSL